MHKSPLLLWVLLLGCLACKTTQYTPDKWPDQYISTGSFGGFSGMVTTTYVLPNGQVFSENSLDQKKIETTPLDKKKVKALFKQAEQVNWHNLPENNFGNMSYFISYHTTDTTFEAIWGEKGNHPPDRLTEIHETLQTLLHH